MAFNVGFYTFSKKVNSTARPGSNELVAVVSCRVKDGSGVVHPLLEISTSANVSKWNYCYIEEYSRYYYVNEWTYTPGIWTCSLNCDVLASWKEYIGASTQYIARAAQGYDGNIVDTAYPTKSDIQVDVKSFGTQGFGAGYQSGYYVVGVLNSDKYAQVGGVSYYVFTHQEFGKLKEVLLGSMDYMGVAPADQVLAKTDVNPIQYIVSCKFFPCSVGIGSTVPDMKLGWWQPAGISCHRLVATPLTVGKNSVTLPPHPQASTRGNYLKHSPYTQYSLTWGVWGEIELPTEITANYPKIYTQVIPDPISGIGLLDIQMMDGGGNAVRLGSFEAPFAVDVPLGQLSMDVATVMPQSTWVKDLTSGTRIGGFVNGVLQMGEHMERSKPRSTLDNFIGAAQGLNRLTSATVGGVGCISHYALNPLPKYYAAFSLLADEDLASAGRPVCTNVVIGSLHGFIKCAHVEIALPATDSELADVITEMEGGFFYE